MQSTWNPWPELSSRPEVRLVWIDLVGFEERRSVISHELIVDRLTEDEDEDAGDPGEGFTFRVEVDPHEAVAACDVGVPG